jgi:hypothetical protein
MTTPDIRTALERLVELQDDTRPTSAIAGDWADAIADARWGRLAKPEPPTIAPIPMSERLPGPKDCDAEGCLWIWTSTEQWERIHGDSWALHSFTYWLPAHALPLPTTELPTSG